MLYKELLLIIILLGFFAFTAFKVIPYKGQKHVSQYTKLVWCDNFEKAGPPDSEKWFRQTKLPPGGNWWGGLIQHYTDRDENTYVKDGQLYLMAIKEEFTDQGEFP